MEMTSLITLRWLKASTMPISARRTATAPRIRPTLIPFCQRPKPCFIAYAFCFPEGSEKFQIPSTKFQIISKTQSPNSKPVLCIGLFENWNLFGNLEFGVILEFHWVQAFLTASLSPRSPVGLKINTKTKQGEGNGVL